MDWQSVLTVGAFVALAGICLGIIVHWWRSRSEWREAKARSPQITGVGFVTFGLAVAALFAGIAMSRLAPESFLGYWIDALGLPIWLVVCTAIFGALAGFLERLGYPSMKSKQRRFTMEERK